MTKRLRTSAWTRSFQRSLSALSRTAIQSGARALKQALAKAPGTGRTPRKPLTISGAWLPGVALGPGGARRYKLYRPPDLRLGEQLPLMVMLHGCGQDADSFAASTRMNGVALRERFFVLYPEQDRMANAQGCWNWFETQHGRAYAEVGLILQALDQVCLLHAVDRSRIAVAGLSAGASMAALLVTRHPSRFKAVAMHSGIAPGSAHSGLTALGAMQGRRSPQPLAARTAVPGVSGTGWPPLLVLHGEADTVVSPHNGQAAAQVWADAAGATAGAPRQVQRGQRHPMAVTDFKRSGRTVATLVEVGKLGHAWSGGAASQPFSDGQGPDASRMVWAFAARQFGA